MYPATALIATGGLVFGLLRRGATGRDGTYRPMRAVLVLLLLTWAPLVVLTLLDGTFAGDAVPVPFVRDPAVHARLLVALPLLVLTEGLVATSVDRLLAEVRQRALLEPGAEPALERALAHLVRWRDSRLVEAIVVGAVAVGIWLQRPGIVAARVTPLASWLGSGGQLSPAGWWYFTIAAFLTFVLGVRWAWWLALWTRFLAGFLRKHIRVQPGHPDAHAGLAFLARTQGAFAPVFASLSATMAGRLGHDILHLGRPLEAAIAPVAVVLVVAPLVMYGPLALFAPRVWGARRRVLCEYDRLGQALVDRFDVAWVRDRHADERLLGDAAPSTLIDFAGAYGEVRRTRLVPIDLRPTLPALLMVAAPFLPLLLTQMSAADLARKVIRLLI
jgi:hypothetical protein